MDKLPQIIFREWDTYNLFEDCALDKHNLDIEAERQSALMNKWMDLLHQARRILSRLERALKLTESKLYLDAAQGAIPGQKDKKPTDAYIKAWINTQPRYIQAMEARDEAEENVYYLEKNAKVSLEHKKAMILAEKDLWICGYFSRPSVPNTVKAFAEKDIRDQTKTKLADSLAKRTRRDAEE
jgi:hypothetical protein